MDYAADTLQSAGGGGFDVFGLLCGTSNGTHRREVFVASGCALLVERELFVSLGGFDPLFFMYADEYDLCWRIWAAGRTVIAAPSARMHHRGAAAVNPRGYQRVLESRTSDSKRYYANRNNLLVLLKNGQHALLGVVGLQLGLLMVEAVAMSLWTRRWSHIRRAYLDAVRDCWRLRPHILAERRRLRQIRRHGDIWMLRFLCSRMNRWEEIRRCMRFGLPKVDPE
jgi:GT2 family glycosyltransferase